MAAPIPLIGYLQTPTKAILRNLVRDYVQKGFQRDSLRRQLNRAGISSRDTGLTDLWRQVSIEETVKPLYRARSPLWRPRVGRDMAPLDFKDPFSYRHVARVEFFDPNTGEIESQVLSRMTNNESLNKGQIEKGIQDTLETTWASQYKVGAQGGRTIVSVNLEMSYHQEGII